jgi:hypothetical protein
MHSVPRPYNFFGSLLRPRDRRDTIEELRPIKGAADSNSRTAIGSSALNA